MSPIAKNLMGAVAALALTAWQGAALSTSLSGTAGQTHSVTVHYADLDLNRAPAGSAGAERLPSPVPDRCRSEGGACLLPRVQQALTDIERAGDRAVCFERSYWVVWPNRAHELPGVKAFISWLRIEAAAFPAPSSAPVA
jgi:UrcA family protein